MARPSGNSAAPSAMPASRGCAVIQPPDRPLPSSAPPWMMATNQALYIAPLRVPLRQWSNSASWVGRRPWSTSSSAPVSRKVWPQSPAWASAAARISSGRRSASGWSASQAPLPQSAQWGEATASAATAHSRRCSRGARVQR